MLNKPSKEVSEMPLSVMIGQIARRPLHIAQNAASLSLKTIAGIVARVPRGVTPEVRMIPRCHPLQKSRAQIVDIEWRNLTQTINAITAGK